MGEDTHALAFRDRGKLALGIHCHLTEREATDAGEDFRPAQFYLVDIDTGIFPIFPPNLSQGEFLLSRQVALFLRQRLLCLFPQSLSCNFVFSSEICAANISTSAAAFSARALSAF